MKKILVVVLFFMMGAGLAGAAESDGVYFVSPSDSSVHRGNVQVVMAVSGMRVQKAGELQQGTGHFHIIIDGQFVPAGEPVAKDATHIHFGKGQTEASLALAKGEHTLTLQFADGHHVSYGKAWSKTIHVQVK